MLHGYGCYVSQLPCALTGPWINNYCTTPSSNQMGTIFTHSAVSAHTRPLQLGLCPVGTLHCKRALGASLNPHLSIQSPSPDIYMSFCSNCMWPQGLKKEVEYMEVGIYIAVVKPSTSAGYWFSSVGAVRSPMFLSGTPYPCSLIYLHEWSCVTSAVCIEGGTGGWHKGPWQHPAPATPFYISVLPSE